MNQRLRFELERIEAVCNRFPEGTVVMINDSPDDVYILPDGNCLSKEEFLIVRSRYDRFWVYFCDTSRQLTYKCNRVNKMIALGNEMTLEEHTWDEDWLICNHTTHETFAFPRGSVNIVTDTYGKPYIVPMSAVSIHDNRVYRTSESRYGEEFMIINNLNDETIRESGKLKISADGIKFSSFYSDKETTIATTKDLLEIFGSGVLSKIWNYALSDDGTTIDRMVKAKIIELLNEED